MALGLRAAHANTIFQINPCQDGTGGWPFKVSFIAPQPIHIYYYKKGFILYRFYDWVIDNNVFVCFSVKPPNQITVHAIKQVRNPGQTSNGI